MTTAQLGFDAFLAKAEGANRARRFERETGHLPDTMSDAVPFMRLLIRQHHAAMLDANVDQVMALRDEAHKLALRLNGGEPGILAHDDAPGYALARETAAAPATVPQWGQTGDFIVTVSGMAVQIELDGFFGIGATHCFWPGFAAYAVDYDRPFLSETGYRSFLGIHADPAPGLSPDEFVCKVIAAHIERELKRKPVVIAPCWRKNSCEA